VILYPAIDIRGGGAVRLTQGDFERETAYDADPVDAAKRFAGDGAEWLHVVDLDGAREGKPQNLDAVERIAAAVDCPVQVGGGIRDVAALEAVLEAGARRVVIGTAALADPDFLDAALQTHSDRVLVSVDAKSGTVALEGWVKSGETDVAEAVASLTERRVERFLFTPIEVDGTMEGPAIDQLKRVAAATSAEVIYSGGVGDLSDLRSLASTAPANVNGVIVGRALYENHFTVAEARQALANLTGG
jgi:phosphoribosylformimino-5-aminoimidazole carboxamide ribotide isomerase